MILVNKSYIASDYEETESDIVYRAKIGETEAIFYVLLEFQSSVDYRMPLRLFFYISEILREYSKNAKHKAYDRDIKVPAIIPIVLYNGLTPWDAKTRLRDIICNEDMFGDSIIDFKYDIFDINNKYTKEELLNLKTMTSAVFLLDQKIDPQEFLQRIKVIALFFDGLNEKEMQVLKHWIKNSVEHKLAEEAIKILSSSKEEVENMVSNNAFILTEALEKAESKGMDKGIILARREDIIDNLKDIDNVPDEIKKMINNEKDVEILKKWVKISARVNSLQEFKDKIKQ